MAWAAVVSIALTLTACSGCSGSSGGPGGSAVEPLLGSCPADFEPQPGENRGFPSDGALRTFHVLPPAT